MVLKTIFWGQRKRRYEEGKKFFGEQISRAEEGKNFSGEHMFSIRQNTPLSIFYAFRRTLSVAPVSQRSPLRRQKRERTSFFEQIIE